MATEDQKLTADLEDRKITCKDCKQPFTFTVKDQLFYKEKSFQEPKRCRPCRDDRKREQVQ